MPRAQMDYLTRDGAFILADRIRHYWRDKKIKRPVLVEVVALDNPIARRSKDDPFLYVVRSNLVNGLPPKATA